MAARDRAPAPEAGRAVVTSAPRPVWPITAGLVVVGLCLLAWDVFGAVITTAPFFGDQPSRNDVIESGMVLVTSAVPVVMLCVVGVQAGSRLGLLLLVLPACLLVPMGLEILGRTRDPATPGPGRPVGLADAVTGLTIPNWLVAVSAAVVLVVVATRRRRGRAATGV